MSEPTETSTRRFFRYPKPVEGPKIPFHAPDEANPALSGVTLLVAGVLVSKFEFLQKLLYNNAGLNSLRKLDFGDTKERWEPTVIPLASQAESSYIPNLDPLSFQDLPENLPGRYHTVVEYHAKYVSGELTPLAVCESLLPLIRRDIESPSPHSVAFIATNVSSILAAAKESTARYAAGKPLGLLDGVPTAIKDQSNVVGYRTTLGQLPDDKLFPIADESTWEIQKLEDSGAIILGKTNMHEIGADTSGNNPNWGTTRTPYNKQYYSGGSSGGSAYAVAAGLVPFALGADGGGSIRIPASFCGIYGLKTTHGRLEDMGSTCAVTGPLAATMTDLEAMYRVLAHPDPSDPTSSLFAPPNKVPTSQPKIIGICKPWFENAESSVLTACQTAVNYYKKELGYEVVEIEIPYLVEGQKCHAYTVLSELAIRTRSRYLPNSSWTADLNPANKIILSVGAHTSGQDYLLAQQLRNILMQHLSFLFKKYPGLLIVTPTSAMPGWNIRDGDLKYGFFDGNISLRSMEYIWLANFCGTPAISVPIGYVDPIAGEGKVPIGLMAMAEWGGEDQLLGWGREAEVFLNEVYEGGRIRPGGDGWVDVLGVSGSRLEAESVS